MGITPGTRMVHKKFGVGTVQEYLERLHVVKDDTLCYFKPDVKLPNHGTILLVDVESLKEVSDEKNVQ